MSKFPAVKPRQVVWVLLKIGFTKHSRMRGSHLVLKHSDGRRTTVPMHRKDVPIGTLLAILKDMKIPKEEFLDLL